MKLQKLAIWYKVEVIWGVLNNWPKPYEKPSVYYVMKHFLTWRQLQIRLSYKTYQIIVKSIFVNKFCYEAIKKIELKMKQRNLIFRFEFIFEFIWFIFERRFGFNISRDFCNNYLYICLYYLQIKVLIASIDSFVLHFYFIVWCYFNFAEGEDQCEKEEC